MLPAAARRIFVFNGDADGLCALQQLHLAEGMTPDRLVTGPKRRIALLAEVVAGENDQVTVLDVSFHTNRDAVARLLAAGAHIRYFDHHHAGEIPAHPHLSVHIDTSPGVCTSAIVDRHLVGRHRAWAAVGAFGDNLQEMGRRLAAGLGLGDADSNLLATLGTLLNYNAYGEREEDLFFAPADLHRRLARYRDPLAFAREDPAFQRLSSGYAEDMAHAASLSPELAAGHAAVYRLPDASWARRVSGVLANRLARASPARAQAILCPNSMGGLLVSVRAPLERPTGAAALCLRYAGGGGREAAAGIDHLAPEEVERFTAHFLEHFSPHR
jgi:hypothetical protein